MFKVNYQSNSTQSITSVNSKHSVMCSKKKALYPVEQHPSKMKSSACHSARGLKTFLVHGNSRVLIIFRSSNNLPKA